MLGYIHMKKQIALIAAVIILCAPAVFAWGNQGHHMICAAASRLVSEKELIPFLKARQNMMGHLCNVPDTYWRNLDSSLQSLGNPTHYLNPEVVNHTVDTLPQDFKAIAKHMNISPRGLNSMMGSLWWRTDQFYRLAVAAGKRAKQTPTIPKNTRWNKKQMASYDRAVFEMLVSMGVMGHYIGDAAMPYHNILDYDGWKKGRGGIHSFYESESVDQFDLHFLGRLFDTAQTLKDTTGLKPNDVLGRMRALSILSKNDIPQIEANDEIFERSKQTPPSRKEMKSHAKRPPAEIAFKKFEPLILNEMARAARQLAGFWDALYVDAGRPDLSVYKNYEYPLTPDFIAPDYL